MHHKLTLAEKICPNCKLLFKWRKKWVKNWHKVKFCSKKCANSKATKTPTHS